MNNKIDQSVSIGDNAKIRGSAIGSGAKVVSKTRGFLASSIAMTVVLGVVSNALWAWIPRLLKWITQH